MMVQAASAIGGDLARTVKNPSWRPSNHQQRNVRTEFAPRSTTQRISPRLKCPATVSPALSATPEPTGSPAVPHNAVSAP